MKTSQARKIRAGILDARGTGHYVEDHLPLWRNTLYARAYNRELFQQMLFITSMSGDEIAEYRDTVGWISDYPGNRRWIVAKNHEVRQRVRKEFGA